MNFYQSYHWADDEDEDEDDEDHDEEEDEENDHDDYTKPGISC